MKKLLNIFDQSIDYHPIYTKVTGSIASSLLLSHICHLSKENNDQEFCKTDADFWEELVIGQYEFKSAQKKLIDLELIELSKKGIPAKTYYKLNLNLLNMRIKMINDG